MTTSVASTLSDQVHETLRSVFDPEYPDISIVDLGLVEQVEADDASGQVTVGLIPTFSGCPALQFIATDVEQAVRRLPMVRSCVVQWLSAPVWSVNRIAESARKALAADYTVVLRHKDGGLRCPVCGSAAVQDQSMAGPTRCRSVAWCNQCRNPVEVMR